MEIVIVADDLTGTLDAAAPLIARGVAVRTRCTDPARLFAGETAAVVAVNADTRHCDPVEAQRIVFAIMQEALKAGAQILIKKTDSALRGNVGAELEGMLEAARCQADACSSFAQSAGQDAPQSDKPERSDRPTVCFIPALPSMGRVTAAGAQYIDGTPVNQSVFGSDPFEPVMHARVRDIIAEQATELSVIEVYDGERIDLGSCDVVVCDAATDQDVEHRVRETLEASQANRVPALFAGCSGLTQALCKVLPVRDASNAAASYIPGDEHLLVFCGSVNQVSLDQCAYARAQGTPAFSLSAEAKFYPTWCETPEFAELKRAVWQSWDTEPLVLIESGERFTLDQIRNAHFTGTSDELRALVSGNLGRVLAHLCAGRGPCTVLAMGGDVFLAFITELGVESLTLVAEAERGVIVSEFEYGGATIRAISKSGGFGAPDLFVRLASQLLTVQQSA